MLDLRGFVILQTVIYTILFYHKYGIVRELPIDVIIGGAVLISYQCTLSMQSISRKTSNLEIEAATSVQFTGKIRIAASEFKQNSQNLRFNVNEIYLSLIQIFLQACQLY